MNRARQFSQWQWRERTIEVQTTADVTAEQIETRLLGDDFQAFLNVEVEMAEMIGGELQMAVIRCQAPAVPADDDLIERAQDWLELDSPSLGRTVPVLWIEAA